MRCSVTANPRSPASSASAIPGAGGVLSDSDESLTYLELKLREAPCMVAICGTTGTGRSRSLRLLLARLAAHFEPLYVPTGRLAVAELEAWVESAQVARSAPATALALGIDEADDLDESALAWLQERVAAGTRVVLVLLSDHEGKIAERFRRALHTRVFTEPLSLRDAQRHVEARLAEAGHALPTAVVDRIVLASRGVPGELHRLSEAEILRATIRDRAQDERAAPPDSAPARVAARRWVWGFGVLALLGAFAAGWWLAAR